MSLMDYAAMSYQELRRYFLTHQDDTATFPTRLLWSTTTKHLFHNLTNCIND